MTKRGIVIVPPYQLTGTTLHIEDPQLDPLMLRQAVLYWDLIDWPTNRVIHISDEGLPDIQLLKQEGILSRSELSMPTPGPVSAQEAWALMQVAALLQNNRRPRQQWCIGQDGFELIVPLENSIPSRMAEVELYQSIPIPIADVPLERILEFRARRQDELLRFRDYMDALYLDIVRSQDIPRARTHTVHKIEQSIRALNRVMEESRLRRFMSTVKVELNLSDALKQGVVTGIGTAAAAAALHLQPEWIYPFSAVVGLASSLIKVRITELPKPRALPSELTDFAYVYHVHRELEPYKANPRSGQ